jgi:hypothetical protein
LSFANATSRWRETRLSPGSGTPYDPLAPPRRSLRAVAPGEHVSVMLWWSNWCGRGAKPGGGGSVSQSPSAIVLTLPGGGQVRLSHAGQNTGHDLPAPVCGAGPGTLSTLQAGNFTPFVPQGGPGLELPLRARIVSAVTPPSFVVRPGSWLSYTVALTNRSSHAFRFGPACPNYTEGFARQQAYVLNCRPVGSIGPGKSVRFAMRLRVPRHLDPSGPAFNWTLAPHSWNAPQAMGVVSIG